MNMKNKFLICLIFVLSLLTCAASAEEVDSKVTDFLINTGFITEEQTKEPDSYITRGDFADMAARLIPNRDGITYTAEQQVFGDLSIKDSRYQSIMYMTETQIVKGVSAVEFAPNDEIRYNDACAVMVRILGYDFNKSENYISEAGKYGIINGVHNDSNKITRRSALRMMYNMLFAKLDMKVTVNNITVSEKGLFMTERFGIHEINGIVEDDGKTALTGESTIGNDNIKISGTVYADKTNKACFGCNVYAYYKEIDNTDTVIYVYAPDTKNVIEEYDASDIKDFDGITYSVYTDEKQSKTKTRKLVKDYKIIYNTKSVTGGISQDKLKKYMKPDCGSVRLIDNDNDGSFEIVIVVSYETVIVKWYSGETKTVYNKYKKPESVSFDGIDTVEAENTSGNYMTIDNIAENNVLSVMRSIDGNYARVIISGEYAQGTLESITGDMKEITIGGKTYSAADELKEYIDTPPVGTNVKAFIRHDGKIAYFTAQPGENGMMVYVQRAYYSDNNSDKVILKAYTENKEAKEITVANRVSIDGQSFKTAEKVMEYLTSQETGLNNIVLIKFNDDGEAVSIDLPYKDGIYKSGETAKSWHIADGMYMLNTAIDSGVINGKIGADDTAKVFIVPENGAIEDCSVVNIYSGYVSNYSAKYKYSVYTSDDDKMLADAIIIYRDITGYDLHNSSVAARRPRMIVTDVKQVVNADTNDLCWDLTVTNGGYETSVRTKTEDGIKCWKSGKSVQIGDIIRYGTDKSGYIPDNQLVICYSPAADKNTLIYDTGDFNGVPNRVFGEKYQYALVMGKAYEMNERFIRIHNMCKGSLGEKDEMQLFGISNMKYIVYDKTQPKKVQFGDWTDVVTEVTEPSNTDVHVFDYEENSINYVYVVK